MFKPEIVPNCLTFHLIIIPRACYIWHGHCCFFYPLPVSNENISYLDNIRHHIAPFLKDHPGSSRRHVGAVYTCVLYNVYHLRTWVCTCSTSSSQSSIHQLYRKKHTVTRGVVQKFMDTLICRVNDTDAKLSRYNTFGSPLERDNIFGHPIAYVNLCQLLLYVDKMILSNKIQ